MISLTWLFVPDLSCWSPGIFPTQSLQFIQNSVKTKNIDWTFFERKRLKRGQRRTVICWNCQERYSNLNNCSFTGLANRKALCTKTSNCELDELQQQKATLGSMFVRKNRNLRLSWAQTHWRLILMWSSAVVVSLDLHVQICTAATWLAE